MLKLCDTNNNHGLPALNFLFIIYSHEIFHSEKLRLRELSFVQGQVSAFLNRKNKYSRTEVEESSLSKTGCRVYWWILVVGALSLNITNIILLHKQKFVDLDLWSTSQLQTPLVLIPVSALLTVMPYDRNTRWLCSLFQTLKDSSSGNHTTRLS